MTYFLNFLWIEKSYWKHTEREKKNYCKVCFKWQKPYFSHVNFCCFGICFVCFQERGGNCCWKHNWTFLFFMLSIKLSNFFLLGNERKTRTVFFVVDIKHLQLLYLQFATKLQIELLIENHYWFGNFFCNVFRAQFTWKIVILSEWHTFLKSHQRDIIFRSFCQHNDKASWIHFWIMCQKIHI